MKVTAALLAMVEDALAETVAVPADVPLVSVIVATPLALVVDVEAERLPRLVDQVTGSPEPSAFPFPSFTVAVSTAVVNPVAAIDVAEVVKELTIAVAALAINVTGVELPVDSPEVLATSVERPVTVDDRVTAAWP